ncbi:hypothetical protein PtrM4_142580 [Pyrenophora tritici-repentis]|uniref:Integrase catalytic domain-containing protein n=3 Tax=Pyrenophora tritici-repentis TaxID=45151 RepID=A0A834VMX1_9PLEO|nr:hypothetical protein PtrM4_142580 [Pyrenophora tritici-repentis]
MAEAKEEWKIPKLTAENHDAWFRRNKVKLKGKRVFYVCEKSLEKHCQLPTPGDLSDAVKELDITDNKTIKVCINVDMRNKYLEDEATAIDLLFRSLSDDDQALIDEYDTAFQFWAYLRKKYTQTDATAANMYMTRIQTFTFDSESTIIGSWEKLKDYRRKLVAADADTNGAYKDSALLLILIRSLPTRFRTTVDAVNAQLNLTVEQKLKFLEEKEVRDQQDANEQALPAFRKAYKYVPLHKRGDKDLLSLSSDSEPDSEDEEIETCRLSKDILGKASPSTWAGDTGASSHMSDQPSLFRQMIKIKRRLVRVGGGELHADWKGEAQMVCKDGSSIWLSDVLLVPNLGVNLLSGRRICAAGLKGRFNSHTLSFRLGKKTIIKATMDDGLYVVSHIADGYQETAFPGTELDTPAQDTEVLHTPDESELKAGEKERYLLYHRRFAHLGPAKIAKLHEVTTLEKKIQVPEKKEICEVCALTKMRNSIPKQLRDHKDEKLALVQFDVAGPFPTSLRGNRWFLLIIDSYTRKNWVVPLKQKGDAQKELRAWKIFVEHQTDEKVKAAGTDNAPELLQQVEEWRVTYGVELQPTTIASSYQNGPAERNIQTAEADMRAMLKDAGLPIEFWDEAVEADAYLRNRTSTGPTIDEKQVSPEEAFTGRTPSIDHIRVWGSRCYSYINPKTIPADQRHDKLVDRGRIGVFMGYSETTNKQFKFYSPELGYTSRSSRISVDEYTPGGKVELRLRNIPAGPQGTQNIMPDRKPRGRPRKDLTPTQPAHAQPAPAEPTPAEPTPAQPTEQAATEQVEPPTAEEMEPPPAEQMDTSPAEQVELNPEPIERRRGRPRKLTTAPPTTVSRDERVPDLATEESEEPVQSLPEAPRYFTRGSKRKRAGEDTAEDERFRKIIKAMLAQVNLTDKETDEDAYIFEKAFPATEIAGIQIPKTYQQAIRDLRYGNQWKAAVLEEITSLIENGTWEEVVPPKDANMVDLKWVFTIKTKPDGTVERFKARLVARGFTQVHGIDYNETFAPTVRMDTLRLFLATVAAEDLECFHYDIKNAFTESHLKELILLKPPEGVHVKKGHVLKVLRSLYGLKQAARDWNLLMKKELLAWGFVQSLADPCMFVHKERKIRILVYVDDVLAAAKEQSQTEWFWKKLSGRFNAKNLGEVHKVLRVRVTRDRKHRTIFLDQEQYLCAVLEKFGMSSKKHKDKKIPSADYTSFRPATDNDTRIDTTEYQQGIGSLMFAMVLTRPDIAFTLGKLSQHMSDPAEHHGYALKNLLRDVVDRKSVSGSTAMFYGGPISWSSKKQRSVATSSCESEYIALSTCCKQGQWIAQVFRDLGFPKYIGKDTNKVQMLGDNQGAIALTKNPHLHERSKHIDVCYHYVRDLAEQGKLDVAYVPTAEMVADGMTKPLQRVAFERFKNQLGPVIGMVWSGLV